MTTQLVQRESTATAKAPGAFVASRSEGGFAAWALGFVRELAVLDWYMLVYFAVVTLAVLFGTGPGRSESLSTLGLDVLILCGGLILSRGGVLKKGSALSQLVYRLSLAYTLVASYFQMRVILPAVTSRAVDAQILAFDLRVFHVEPSIAWDAFVTPRTTEWFAFFYFGYFFVLAAHVLPFTFLVKQTQPVARFALGIFFVFSIGHLTYMLVPGYGPYRYLAGHFEHELTGGTFWDLVKEAVAGAGAQKDIFPSLHTAVPTFLTIFSFVHRKSIAAYRYTWLLQAFVTTQIIVATMFLRWHYLIDIFAGLALAAAAMAISVRVVAWETGYRARAGLSPAWEPLRFWKSLPGGRS